MLIGQRHEESERERRQRKSHLYREMLDQQIQMNSQHRKRPYQRSPGADPDWNSEAVMVPTVEYDSIKDIQRSIVHDHQPKGSRSRNLFLPQLKDKNTFYRGSSTYIKVNNSGLKPQRETRHTYTQQIEEEREEEEDYEEYDSTCQRIIKQLQSIKSKPIKFRTRRRLYGASETAQRRNYEGNMSDVQYSHHESNQVSSLPATALQSSVRPRYNPESRHSEVVSADLKPPQKQPNQLSQFRAQPKITKKVVFAPLDGQIQRGQTYNIRSATTPNDQFEREYSSSKLGNRNETMNQSSFVRDASEDTEFNFSQDVRKKQASRMSTSPAKQSQRGENQGREEASRLQLRKEEAAREQDEVGQRLGLQRQNFVQLLRKVKNRGQSLRVKLSRFPLDRTSQL